MIRRVTFDTDRHFPMVWEGVLTGIVVKPAAERDVARKKMEWRVLKKLKAISDPEEGKRTMHGEEVRAMKPAPQVVDFTVDELKLLVECIELPSWVGTRLDEVFSATEFLDSAAKVDD